MRNVKIYILLFFVIISVKIFSLFFFPPSLDFYLLRSKQINELGYFWGYPLKTSSYMNGVYMGFDIPIGNEKIINNTVDWLRGWYIPTNEDQAIFDKYNYSSIPILTFNLIFGNGKNWEIEMRNDFQEGSTYYFQYGDLRLWDIPDKGLLPIALDFPYKAYMNFEVNDNTYISFGRFKKSVGFGDYSLILSGASAFYDGLNLITDLNKLKYEFFYFSAIPQLHASEYASQMTSEATKATKDFLFQRIILNLKPLTIGVSFLNLAGGEYFEMKNFVIPKTNWLLSLNTNLSLKPFRFYGEYTFNDNSFGYFIGMEILKKLKELTYFSLKSEYYYVGKDLYKGNSPYSYLTYRTIEIINYPGSRIIHQTPIGFPYGDDAQIYRVSSYLVCPSFLISFFLNSGKVREQDLFDINFRIQLKFFGFDPFFDYSKTSLGDQIFERFQIFFTLPLDLSIQD